MKTKKLTLRLMNDGRPLCPQCGQPLYAAVEEYTTGVIPVWAGEDGAYAGFDADPLNGHSHESDLVSLYCPCCSWWVDPRESKIGVDNGLA